MRRVRQRNHARFLDRQGAAGLVNQGLIIGARDREGNGFRVCGAVQIRYLDLEGFGMCLPLAQILHRIGAIVQIILVGAVRIDGKNAELGRIGNHASAWIHTGRTGSGFTAGGAASYGIAMVGRTVGAALERAVSIGISHSKGAAGLIAAAVFLKGTGARCCQGKVGPVVCACDGHGNGLGY